MTKRHSLDDAFDIDYDADSLMSDDDSIDVEIPSDPEKQDLEFVILRALTEYADIKNMLKLIEPKNRLKYFEMARDFLNMAKDARYKLDYLKQKESTGKKTPVGQKEDLTNQETGVISREELVKQMKVVK